MFVETVKKKKEMSTVTVAIEADFIKSNLLTSLSQLTELIKSSLLLPALPSFFSESD